MPHTPEVPSRVQDLAARLAEPRPMRRGSLTERRVKCCRPGCSCADRPEARHGPYFSFTRAVGGRTCTRLFLAPQATEVRQQIEAGRRFRKLVEEFWEACEQWADAELDAASPEREEKGGSGRSSKRRSPGRSKPL